MNITRIEMEKQGAENKIPTNLTEGAGKKLRKRKEACDETLGDKPRVKDEDALDFGIGLVVGATTLD